MEYTQSKSKVSYCWNRLGSLSGSDITGEIVTPHGIVSASSWTYAGDNTTLEMVHDGYMHCRYFPRRVSRRTLVTLARKFAEEICTGA